MFTNVRDELISLLMEAGDDEEEAAEGAASIMDAVRRVAFEAPRAWIEAERKKILDDERHHYKPALVHVNAPLALIQVQLATRLAVLAEMLAQIGAP